MSTAAKKSKIDRALDKALAAEPKEVKVHISLRLDSDIYLELQRRADEGEANGKYQTLLNDLLRSALFESENRSYVAQVSKNDTYNAFTQFLDSRGIVMHKVVTPKSAGKTRGTVRATKKQAKAR